MKLKIAAEISLTIKKQFEVEAPPGFSTFDGNQRDAFFTEVGDKYATSLNPAEFAAEFEGAEREVDVSNVQELLTGRRV